MKFIMSFLKNFEEMKKREMSIQSADFFNTQILNLFWLSKPEIIKKLIPPPLKPSKIPLVHAFIANYPQTNFGLPYKECAIFLRVEYNGAKGNYCLSMPVTNDMAMAAGREYFGFPRKIAFIELKHNGNEIEGWAERLGTIFFHAKLKITGRFNEDDTMKLLLSEEILKLNGRVPILNHYSFKHYNSPEFFTFEHKTRLIKEITEIKPKVLKLGEAEIKLDSSIHDPWAEIENVRLLGGIYYEGDYSMQKGIVIDEIDPEITRPYSFIKWDWYGKM